MNVSSPPETSVLRSSFRASSVRVLVTMIAAPHLLGANGTRLPVGCLTGVGTSVGIAVGVSVGLDVNVSDAVAVGSGTGMAVFASVSVDVGTMTAVAVDV